VVDRARRRLLAGALGTGGMVGLTLVGCSSSKTNQAGPTTGATASSSTAPTAAATPTTAVADTCMLMAEMTSGPYYLDGAAVRRDVTEDRKGFPLALAFTVVDSTSCAPLAGAAVDIWHCDANGEYSGWNGNTLAETFHNGRNDKTYLRGIQITGDDGVARFTTIYPGWYEGRAIHIHLKVHVDGHVGTADDGGHVAHVGQVFFDDDQSDALMRLGEYAKHPGTRTRNDADSIFAKGGASQIVKVTPSGAARPDAGFHGAVTLAIDPDATPKALPVA
jgi:protocatechuate 3,4-dioxygenase beta subunit